MNNGNSGYSSSNQGGYSSTGSQQVGSGSGYTSSNQNGPTSGGGYQPSGGYHSSGNHQQITYSTQTPHGFFSPNSYQQREYVVYDHHHDRYRDDVCCTII